MIIIFNLIYFISVKQFYAICDTYYECCVKSMKKSENHYTDSMQYSLWDESFEFNFNIEIFPYENSF